jgi:hypothetical protein
MFDISENVVGLKIRIINHAFGKQNSRFCIIAVETNVMKLFSDRKVFIPGIAGEKRKREGLYSKSCIKKG